MTALAFYAPMKPPDHPVPSGDREIARLLLRLLPAAGFRPEVASRLVSFDKAGDATAQERIAGDASAEITRLVDLYGNSPAPPALWLTYHVYYKAPDLVGPKVARALAIPYVVAEGSRAGKRRQGPWARWHQQAEEALDEADLILCLNPADMPGLESARPDGQSLALLPPFIDVEDWPDHPREASGGEVRLLAVAMMREGDKLASYETLAAALALGPAEGWRLDIVGDGPARATVEALFAPFGEQVRFRGVVEGRDELGRLYRSSDLLVWPAVNEALGMVILEAACNGCSALAGSAGGVPAIVADGETGRLVPPGDAAAFAAALAALLGDRDELPRLGERARRAARERHSLPAAAARMRDALRPLVRDGASRP